jgi:hypothetical protein
LFCIRELPRQEKAFQRIWMQTIFEGRNSDMKEKIIDDLLQYCKLDTLAMVEIWRVLKELK